MIPPTGQAKDRDSVSNLSESTLGVIPHRGVYPRATMKRLSFACVWVFLCLFASTVNAQSGLQVVSTGPDGALTSLQHANEIRIVFSEPMVTLGKIPDQVPAPFVRIAPAIDGSFRWSGTTILIFTPERPLPFSTRYEVTVDTTATAVSGRKLEQPYTFDFTTPTVRLDRVRWYRRGGTIDGRIVLLLYFNQPVRSSDVAAALSARFEPHAWTPPRILPDPTQAERYNAKVKQTQAASAMRGPVTLQPTNDWNQETFPPSPQLVAFEVVTDVDPEAWLELTLAGTVRSPAGPATPGASSGYIVETEKAFFIDGFDCITECDPDQRNALRFRTRVNVAAFASARGVAEAATRTARARPPRLAPCLRVRRCQISRGPPTDITRTNTRSRSRMPATRRSRRTAGSLSPLVTI